MGPYYGSNNDYSFKCLCVVEAVPMMCNNSHVRKYILAQTDRQMQTFWQGRFPGYQSFKEDPRTGTVTLSRYLRVA